MTSIPSVSSALAQVVERASAPAAPTRQQTPGVGLVGATGTIFAVRGSAAASGLATPRSIDGIEAILAQASDVLDNRISQNKADEAYFRSEGTRTALGSANRIGGHSAPAGPAGGESAGVAGTGSSVSTGTSGGPVRTQTGSSGVSALNYASMSELSQGLARSAAASGTDGSGIEDIVDNLTGARIERANTLSEDERSTGIVEENVGLDPSRYNKVADKLETLTGAFGAIGEALQAVQLSAQTQPSAEVAASSQRYAMLL